MSTQIPLRIARSPAHALRRQCLFQRRTVPSTPRCIAATPARAFSSTPAQLRKKENRIVDTRMQMAGAESTIYGQQSPANRQQEGQDADQIADDIGLLQTTMVRPPFSRLPSPASWELYSYLWSLVKSKGMGLYLRGVYKRCMQKKGITSYLPVDFLKQKDLKNKAKKMYKRYYDALAAGDAKALSSLCLPPLASSARSQIAARGPVKMSWQLHKFKSARIVSHCASPLGEGNPDTAYRQCIVRLESVQQLSVATILSPSVAHKTRAPKWAPGSAQATHDGVSVTAAPEQNAQLKEKGKVETVVEYVVMQTRVIRGKQEDWKLWGFTSETTPAKLEEDDEYWRNVARIQATSTPQA